MISAAQVRTPRSQESVAAAAAAGEAEHAVELLLNDPKFSKAVEIYAQTAAKSFLDEIKPTADPNGAANHTDAERAEVADVLAAHMRSREGALDQAKYCVDVSLLSAPVFSAKFKLMTQALERKLVEIQDLPDVSEQEAASARKVLTGIEPIVINMLEQLKTDAPLAWERNNQVFELLAASPSISLEAALAAVYRNAETYRQTMEQAGAAVIKVIPVCVQALDDLVIANKLGAGLFGGMKASAMFKGLSEVLNTAFSSYTKKRGREIFGEDLSAATGPSIN